LTDFENVIVSEHKRMHGNQWGDVCIHLPSYVYAKKMSVKQLKYVFELLCRWATCARAPQIFYFHRMRTVLYSSTCVDPGCAYLLWALSCSEEHTEIEERLDPEERLDQVRDLCAIGIDGTTKDKYGTSPVALAHELGLFDIESLLLESSKIFS
jgi:hypothetical protein